MIEIIPTLAFAIVSLLCSAFVILRIVIPILPPHPLSRRVPPSEFGLPNFRSLSAADQSHLWLASLDILALAVFIWQAVVEYLGTTQGYAATFSAASAPRLWFSLTIRQICLLIVATITLFHVRSGRSVSFGKTQWLIWAPLLIVGIVSTAFSSVLAGSKVPSLFPGLIAFLCTVAVISSVIFLSLVMTLIIIRRNLTALNETSDPWPPVREVKQRRRPSFATEDIDGLRDGSSWITSCPSSRRDSISGWSFSTHVSHHQGAARITPVTGSNPSIAPKSSFWFNPATPGPYGSRDSVVPPVPPLPSPYRPTSPTGASLSDPDPFRRNSPGEHPRTRFGSQASWLTSSEGSHTTMTAWSFPTTQMGAHAGHGASMHSLLHAAGLERSSPAPALSSAQVLGGYGYAPGSEEAEKGLASFAVSNSSDLDISIYRALGWLIIIWLPLGLSLPYLATAVSGGAATSPVMPILLSLSVTLSSPLLALNILLRSPIPIPTHLFSAHDSPPAVLRASSPNDSEITFAEHEYKRSASITVVEGRRSGDVWVAKGDAVEGRSKLGRAIGLLAPAPKLSVLPQNVIDQGEVTPPLPMQMADNRTSSTVPLTPQSELPAEFGRLRKESLASSRASGGEESLAFTSRIMVAQRHYSAVATTVLVPASPEKHDEVGVAEATGAEVAHHDNKRHSHLRARSVSSMNSINHSVTSQSISPPPSFPLPPTPPSVKTHRLVQQIAHRKSYSSGFELDERLEDIDEIDVLTAGLLPNLVPGLKVGSDMHIKQNWDGGVVGTRLSKKSASTLGRMSSEFGGLTSEFSSPDMHSTPPAQTRNSVRPRRTSNHKRNHFSLPSLGLGKEGAHSLANWKTEVQSALDRYATVSNADVQRRNTVWGGEFAEPADPQRGSGHDRGKAHVKRSSAMAESKRSTEIAGQQIDVPTGFNSVRSSLATILSVGNWIPGSAASTATLFELDGSGPLAESTPHNSIKAHAKKTNQEEPPMPVLHISNPSDRHSSIVNTRYDENAGADPEPPTSRVFWSTRAVRPLMPKASKLQRKSSSGTKTSPPSGGLRPLSLLQNRDANVMPASPGDTQPLSISKRRTSVQDENTIPSSKTRNLRPLKLARSDTSKVRSILRKNEVLPSVVVRPPSEVERDGSAYHSR